jgi:hypothetical protein
VVEAERTVAPNAGNAPDLQARPREP